MRHFRSILFVAVILLLLFSIPLHAEEIGKGVKVTYTTQATPGYFQI